MKRKKNFGWAVVNGFSVFCACFSCYYAGKVDWWWWAFPLMTLTALLVGVSWYLVAQNETEYRDFVEHFYARK